MVKDLDALIKATFKELEMFRVETILPDLKCCSNGAIKDVLDKQNSLYYQWLCCLIRVMKPLQIVELGGAMGVSAICMLTQLPEESKLYSATLKEHGLEFSYIKTNYPQLTKIIGDDSDMGIWPKGLEWGKVDLLFIDAEHTAEALQRELDIYLPLLKKGTLVLLDDIKMDELWSVWLSINKEKLDLSILHHSGFGCLVN